MITWVVKERPTSWPYDLVCVQIDDEHLLFIQESGACDVAHVDAGLPTDGKWWRFE